MLAPRIGSPLVPAGGGTFGGKTVEVGEFHADPVGRWTHLAVTYDGSVVLLYVDDSHRRDRCLAPSGRPPTRRGSAGTGRLGSTSAGMIDDARVYDRALAPGEVRAVMSAPLQRGAAWVVAADDFDAPDDVVVEQQAVAGSATARAVTAANTAAVSSARPRSGCCSPPPACWPRARKIGASRRVDWQ
jgi:hypothetical protein